MLLAGFWLWDGNSRWLSNVVTRFKFPEDAAGLNIGIFKCGFHTIERGGSNFASSYIKGCIIGDGAILWRSIIYKGCMKGDVAILWLQLYEEINV